jgi:predicted ferric reductase
MICIFFFLLFFMVLYHTGLYNSRYLSSSKLRRSEGSLKRVFFELMSDEGGAAVVVVVVVVVWLFQTVCTIPYLAWIWYGMVP